ncbi:MAG: glycosyltransferase family 2 protein [Desulfarculaceae bacterium]|nr:glycosyltransferase family 2 protein [Desulfarculaceae bacterium]
MPGANPSEQPAPLMVSVVVACHNEADNLEPLYHGLIKAVAVSPFQGCEILIIDDASSDGTHEVAQALASRDDRVKVIRNPINQGFGASLQIGLGQAHGTHLTVLPGDNEIAEEWVARLLSAVGRADLVTCYNATPRARHLLRRVLSRAFTEINNLLFVCRLKYFNGPNLYRVDQLRALPLRCRSLLFNAEAVIRLLRQGRSVYQMGMSTRPQRKIRTSSLRLANLRTVAQDLAKLFWELRGLGR